MEENEFNKKNTPKWLKTIQLNSWEAELLISALVLYALFQIPDVLNDFSHKFFQRGSDFIRVFNVLKSGITFLQFGYILHISVRGIWVASVGFSYVFPNGINNANLKFKGKFKKELEKNPSLVKNVLKLEELSSMIYGLSFTIFGTFIGLSTLLFFFMFVMNYTSPYSPNSITENPTFFGFFSIFYVLCIVIVFIDFITSGLFRRKEWAVDWFYPIAWFFRIITLSFLYRRSMLVLLSNLKGWRARLVSLIIAAIVGGYLFLLDEIGDSKIESYLNKTNEGEFIMGNYESLRSKGDYLISSIQSDIVTDTYLKVFLKDISVFDNMKESPFKNDEIKWDQQKSDSSSFYLNKWLELKIDSNAVQNLRWVNAQHPIERSFGFYTYIDISSLPRGYHRLTITPDTLNLSKKERRDLKNSKYDGRVLTNISFQYDKP
ncbi:hypothetical protein [Ekhidna sp. To15]|uniref:hypothetical protein n=1 Tax=Ekhidna sp. To15 TaxID=3395267 RepID=UPI003F524499